MTRIVPAGVFKANCLRLLDEVSRSRQEICVTKRGRPVARVVPIANDRPALFGRMRGSVRVLGDLVAPTGERWDADS